MTGAPMPAGRRRGRDGRGHGRRSGRDRVRLQQRPSEGVAVRRAGDDVAGRRPALPRRHRSSRRRSPACSPASTRAPSPCSRAPRVGRAVDRRRAGRRRVAAAARPDPREQPDDARRRWSPRPAATAIDLGMVRDDEAELEAVLRDAAVDVRRDRHERRRSAWATTTSSRRCSVAIADMRWMQIAIKPAKPFAFGMLGRHADLRAARQPGQLDGQLRDCSPGPALRKMMGHPRARRARSVVGVADDDLRRRPDGKTHLVRVNGAFERRRRATTCAPVGAQGSHQLAATALADAHRRRCPTATASPPAATSTS